MAGRTSKMSTAEVSMPPTTTRARSSLVSPCRQAAGGLRLTKSNYPAPMFVNSQTDKANQLW